jgi:hypothetical protein
MPGDKWEYFYDRSEYQLTFDIPQIVVRRIDSLPAFTLYQMAPNERWWLFGRAKNIAVRVSF